jgi:hypothetical protein
MGMIDRKYNQSATTARETLVAGSDIKKEYTSYLPAFPCHVQPLEASLSMDLPGGIGKNWLMFCPVLDIKEGDKIVVGATEYRAAGVETYDFSRNPHCEVVIRTFKN